MSNPRDEAVRWMNRMFGIPEGYGNGTVERIVDNIIKAALAEMKATTEESSGDHFRDATKKIEEVQK